MSSVGGTTVKFDVVADPAASGYANPVSLMRGVETLLAESVAMGTLSTKLALGCSCIVTAESVVITFKHGSFNPTSAPMAAPPNTPLRLVTTKVASMVPLMGLFVPISLIGACVFCFAAKDRRHARRTNPATGKSTGQMSDKLDMNNIRMGVLSALFKKKKLAAVTPIDQKDTVIIDEEGTEKC